jgi:hypothetical protein
MKEYKVVANQVLTQEGLGFELNNAASLGWRPILLSTAQASPEAPVSVTVIFEKDKEIPFDQFRPK